MFGIDLSADRAADASAEVRVCRADGSQVPVRLRLLGYDGCEFECDGPFTPDEPVRIHLFRMGWIRARILSVRPPVIEAEFVKNCHV